MLHNKDIFRKYDIRGVFGKSLTAETAERCAKAFALQVIEETGKKHPVLSVGRDIRFSSEELFGAVCSGLISSGVDVADVGVCPSPLTYFSMYTENTDGYIMITGSHNPPEFNGIKVGTKNTVYHSEKIERIYTDIINENFPNPAQKGSVRHIEIKSRYIDFILDHFSGLKDRLALLDRKIKIVIDAGSGTASEIAPAVFRKLGAEVYTLYCTPDGSFPGHHPDPTVEENMAEAKALLLAKKADLAVGFDGDADRLGALDSEGNMIWGDQLIGIFAYEAAQNHRGGKVVADVKAGMGLYEMLEQQGMKSVMYFSGHSMIKEKMKLEKAVIGGEMSSHFFFCDRYYGYDDGIYAAVRLLETYVNRLEKGEISSSAKLTDIMPKYFNTPEIREHCPDNVKFELTERIKKKYFDCLKSGTCGIKDLIDIDGLRIVFEKGWALVRPSNTEPLLVTRYEAKTEAEMNRIKATVEQAVQETKNDIEKKD